MGLFRRNRDGRRDDVVFIRSARNDLRGQVDDIGPIVDQGFRQPGDQSRSVAAGQDETVGYRAADRLQGRNLESGNGKFRVLELLQALEFPFQGFQIKVCRNIANSVKVRAFAKYRERNVSKVGAEVEKPCGDGGDETNSVRQRKAMRTGVVMTLDFRQFFETLCISTPSWAAMIA